MSLDYFEAICASVLKIAALGEAVDVYALALQFQDRYPDCSEAELVNVVSTIVTATPGATAVWVKTTSE